MFFITQLSQQLFQKPHDYFSEIIFSNLIQETVQELLDKKDEMNNQKDISKLLGMSLFKKVQNNRIIKIEHWSQLSLVFWPL